MKKIQATNNIFAVLLIACLLYFSAIGSAAEFITTQPVGKNLSIELLDVEHGDAILIQHANKTMLIDTGDFKHRFAVANKLRARGIQQLDIILLTHQHADHIGGINTILNDFEVGTIYHNGIVNPNSKISRDLMNKFDCNRLTNSVEIGRASCRERVCQSLSFPGVCVSHTY